MKNKMMKTAGLVLASTTMLLANGVVASESIQDSPCEKIFVDEKEGQIAEMYFNDLIHIATLGKVKEAFKIKTRCKSGAIGPGYTSPMEITENVLSVSSSPDPHPLVKEFGDNNSEFTALTSEGEINEDFIKEWVLDQEVHTDTYVISDSYSITKKNLILSSPISVSKYRDNKGEVTTFTSQDGTLEIKVTERDDTENEQTDNSKKDESRYTFSKVMTITEHLGTPYTLSPEERLKKNGYKEYQPTSEIEKHLLKEYKAVFLNKYVNDGYILVK